MLDAPGPTVAGAASPLPAAARPRPARRRQRAALLIVLVLVVALHAALLSRVGESLRFGADEEAGTVAISVRSIEAEASGERADDEQAPVIAEAAPVPSPRAPPLPRPPPAAPSPRAAPAGGSAASSGEPADTSSAVVAPAPAPASAAVAAAAAELPAASSASPALAAAPPPPTADPALPAPAAGSVAGAIASAPGGPPVLLAEGDAPPPTYATQLPPAATLRYEVRRGLYRGSGEMRWQSADGRYSLGLEARMVGFSLLTQSSSGSVGANGLEPERFVDQRLRRPPVAANFQRDAALVTFSGSTQRWPLLPGTQDRLSVLVQLAGIVAGQPSLASDGGNVAMVVVGARGDAAVWTIRFAGFEDVDTTDGPVRAAKWVRKARAVADSGAEIWLDPARSWFPVHATFRNSAGAAEYDLLLERLELAP